MKTGIIDVSIIILNWNTSQLLMDCIESLIAETKKTSTEIIVVDNGSHDGSQAAVKREYPGIILIENNKNLGFARANNIGIRQATGRYICLVNSDIVALDCIVDKMVAYMDRHPAVGVLGPKTVDENYQLKENCRYLPTLRNCCCDNLFLNKLFPGFHIFRGRTLKAETYDQTHPAEVISGCFFMVRREALETVGLLDERFFFYGEDTDWCKRFLNAGWQLVFYSAATAIHYEGASSAVRPVKYYVELEKADFQYWRKHHNIAVCFVYILIKAVHHTLYGSAWFLLFLFRSSNRDYSLLRAKGYFSRLLWLLFRKKPAV